MFCREEKERALERKERKDKKMNYTPKIKNISFDKLRLSTSYLDFKHLKGLAGLNSVSFYPSKSSCYKESFSTSLEHSTLRIFQSPLKPYYPRLQLDSFDVVDSPARQRFLESLIPDLSARLSYLEVAVDFEKDEFFEGFIQQNFLMKYNKKGFNSFEGTQYFGDRKTSTKQVRVYDKEAFYRVEVFFKSPYLSKNHLSLASLSQHNFSNNLIKSISFKELNLEYLQKKLSPIMLEIIKAKSLVDAVSWLKREKIDLRYALQQHPYQQAFNALIKQHWEHMLPVQDDFLDIDVDAIIDSLVFAS